MGRLMAGPRTRVVRTELVQNTRSWSDGLMATLIALPRSFPEPSMGVFFALQALDMLTTQIGLHAGANESSMFVARMMELGPMTGLLISKALALILIAIAFRFKRPRVIVFLNFWFAAVVTWNLAIIVSAQALARS